MAKFKTRARTVDMLGRQQIANISTAISELFKNAHDAYAEHVEVDYFRSDSLLVIRDDGIGMTRDEFENRWLVLGTESKLADDEGNVKSYRPPSKPERAIMGEKGIGRLAIALLGPQVLILSKAIREGKPDNLVMCFIHWGLFELPGINLEEIEIAVEEIPHGNLPSADDVRRLCQKTSEFVRQLLGDEGDKLCERILNDIDSFEVDPIDLDSFLEGRSLKTGGGTHFYVAPADESIAHEIERERMRESKDFTKFLLGFSNSVFRENPPPPIETAFRYWQTDSGSDDIIGSNEFFTADDLGSADHLISGVIDEFGQFKGDVRIYGQQFNDHIISWSGGQGSPTKCGPFEMEVGYVAGAQRESSLPPDDWKRLTDKLNKIGGMYVYRDRIRILPYGNSDVDWLDIEERRTKSAAYYFFSHRRMFGAVKLTRRNNGQLREKAGREGFQQDRAYRQLKDILENIFLQLASDFFRESGEFSEFYNDQRADLERLELARRKRERQVSTKRKNIASALDGFFERVNAGLPVTELATLNDIIMQRMENAAKMRNPDEASSALLDAEREAYRRLADIRDSYRLTKPRGVGLSRPLQRDWNAYLSEVERLNREVFDPFTTNVSQTLGEVANQARLYVDQRRRLGELIQQQAETGKRLVSREAGNVRTSANDARTAALKFARDAIREVQQTISEVEAEFAQKDLGGLSEADIDLLRASFENRIQAVGRKNGETLSKVRDMLTSISSNLEQADDLTELDIVEAMDQELLELREQTDADAEMVQLGLAVAVINHEFEAAIKGVRQSLRELRPWTDHNTDLAALYHDIRNNFDHLDGHLNLFTPLQRRLYRKAIPIKGSDIQHYLRSLFEVRLNRHEVILETTQAFRDAQVTSFPSTVYPVFVNILDNALFWMKDNKGPKTITLDAAGNSFFISNNGPSISSRDYVSIFEQGFSRKPGGRGLGLFISKRALQKEGFNISLIEPMDGHGVTFKIEWDAK